MATPEPFLVVRNLSKTFPGQRALRDVSMEVLPGEIHALVGQNGSGKSTFIKCLSGYHSPDAGGEIIVGGAHLRGRWLGQAHEMGLAFIHQDAGLVPTLSVLENFCLGRGFATGPLFKIRWGVEAERVQKMMAEFDHPISPWALVGHLSSADRTMVAIVRALDGVQAGGRLLVLDEPTAALPQAEVDRLFRALRRVSERGVGILYVSHRLQEIFQLADRVTILRDGARVGTFPVGDLTERKLAELIVGKTLGSYYPPAASNVSEDVLLRVENLSGAKVQNACFTMRRGEIVGVAGLLGSGCSELGRLLFGAERRSAGRVRFKGKEVVFDHPRKAVRNGIGLVSEDRHRDALFPLLTVSENITIADERRFWQRGRLHKGVERREVLDLLSTLKVNPPDPDRAVHALSGGNQQKVVLARWLRLKPDLLICDEPVQGVDIGSKTEIYGLLDRVAADGAAVLLISSEFGDLAHLCDRVLVMRNGKIVAELSRPHVTEERIVELAYLSAEEKDDGQRE